MGQFLTSQAAKQQEAGRTGKKKKEGRRGEEGEAQESSQLSSAEESESSSFQLTPAVEDRPQEARAVDSPGTGRHDALSIADNIKVELGTLDLKWEGQRVTAFFLNQITLGASPSSAESRISHGARASDTGGHLRSPPRRTTSAGNRYPAAEVQSLRNVFMGRELGDCPPLGNNTAEYGKPRAQRRERDDRPPGAQGSRRARAKPEKASGSAAGQTHARGDL